MNTMLLAVAFMLNRNVSAFSHAIRNAVIVCWPVIVLYHLYGGVAGLLQFTTVGERFAGAFAAWSTPLTFPFLTAAASSIVAIFIPSSGGQWVVQGFVTSRAAAQVGTTAEHGLLALSVGDQVGNLVSPFWPVLAGGHRARGLPHVLRLRRGVRRPLVRDRRHHHDPRPSRLILARTLRVSACSFHSSAAQRAPRWSQRPMVSGEVAVYTACPRRDCIGALQSQNGADSAEQGRDHGAVPLFDLAPASRRVRCARPERP